jgi:hypothetical protein
LYSPGAAVTRNAPASTVAVEACAAGAASASSSSEVSAAAKRTFLYRWCL